MPTDIEELLEILDVEQLDEQNFRGEHPSTIMQRSFGGQVFAQALSAAYRTVVGDRFCHSVSGYFLRPGTTDAPIDYHVMLTRDGHSFSTRRVVAKQHGEDIFVMASSFKPTEVGLEHESPPHAQPPSPEQCRPLSEVLAGDSRAAREAWEAEWGVLDVRYVSSSLEDPEEPTARLTVWVKTVEQMDDDPRVHQMVLAYVSDLTILAAATVPHHVDILGPGMQMATINHSMWFHRPIRVDGWVLYDQASPSASNGLGFSIGRLYSGGVLGASCAQEGLIRVLPVEGNADRAPWLKT